MWSTVRYFRRRWAFTVFLALATTFFTGFIASSRFLASALPMPLIAIMAALDASLSLSEGTRAADGAATEVNTLGNRVRAVEDQRRPNYDHIMFTLMADQLVLMSAGSLLYSAPVINRLPDWRL